MLAVADGITDIQALLKKYPHAQLQAQIEEVETLLENKINYNLNVVADRFSYLRQMARPLLEKLTLELAPTGNKSLMTALQIMREIIQDTRRSVPGNINLVFLPKSVRQAVKEGGGINRKRFEAATSTALGDQIKNGNVAIAGSKRFGKLEDFFIDNTLWKTMRGEFFKRIICRKTLKTCPCTLKIGFKKRLIIFLSGQKRIPLPRLEKKDGNSQKTWQKNLQQRKNENSKRLMPGSLDICGQ